MTINPATNTPCGEVYDRIMAEVLCLRKQLRTNRIGSVLVNLTMLKDKSNFIQSLENELENELATHKRSQKIDSILEMLEDEILNYKFSK